MNTHSFDGLFSLIVRPAHQLLPVLCLANPASHQLPHRRRIMDNNPRRELPPPSGMALASEPPVSATFPPSQLPPLPSQWHSEDSLRQWLRTKAEEDKRRQEEERTRQENLRLEQRRVEQSILHDAVQAGIPPHLVPFIFVGIGGGNLARSSLDVVAPQIDLSGLQQAQLQQQRLPPTNQQQSIATQIARHSLSSSDPDLPQSLPPEIRRDNRAIPPNPYASQVAPIQATSSQPGHSSPSQAQLYRGSFQATRVPAAGDSHSHPPRLSTSEFHISQLGASSFQSDASGAPYTPTAAATSAQPAAAPHVPNKPETQPSQHQSIYFHHWVPPGQAQPSTPSTRSRQESTSRSHHHSEPQNSPGRKRKAPGPHPAPPPPISQHEQQSPAMSVSSPGRGASTQQGHSSSHFRQQSDPGHKPRHHEHSELDVDNFQRYRPNHESILNPLPPSSRRTSTDVQHASAYTRPERDR